MKKLLLITLLLIGFTTLSQTKYNITLNTSDNLKEVISDFTNNIETFNRYILDSNLITFSSHHHLSDDYFHNLSYDGRHVISIEREITSFNFTTKTEPGGTDCEDASLVCSNDSFDGTATNFGTQELNGSNSGCLTDNENQSSWYYINVGTGGTLEMTINPTNGNDDYDWAIWGPFTPANAAANCPPTSDPVKCSFSGCTTATGMGSGNGCSAFGCGFLGFFPCYFPATGTGDSEDATGDSWVAPLNVTAGQIYIMVIDNYSNSGDPYDLTWGGSAVLSCTPVVLPIELISFEGKNIGNSNLLEWSTASEINNDYFLLERSEDGYNWIDVSRINGSGNSTQIVNYNYSDFSYGNSVNYYRLSQVDFDGQSETFKVISINNTEKVMEIIKMINVMGQEVDEYQKGFVIFYYSDGTYQKKFID